MNDSTLSNSSLGTLPQETDLIFLQGLTTSPVLKSLALGHHQLNNDESEFHSLNPEGPPNSHETVNGILDDLNILERRGRPGAAELARLLKNLQIRSLLDTHDAIAKAKMQRESDPTSNGRLSATSGSAELASVDDYEGPGADSIRMVGIRKVPGEHLGITVKENEKGELAIARIMAGGMIDRQGLLHVGDVIKEINGVAVSSPLQLQTTIQRANGSITLKIVPSYYDHMVSSQVFVKAFFNYDPIKDSLIPCKEAGVQFREGDILQVLNQEDPSWWQAKIVESSHILPSEAQTGLIPSQTVQENRMAFVKPDFDYTTSSVACGTILTKKKKKTLFVAKRSAEFDPNDISVYEEVAKMPPFKRKTLVLIGAQGVGRRSLKNKLINQDGTSYGTTIPTTSREMREGEEDGKGYWFVDKAEMQQDIMDGLYLESGEYEYNLYGTRLDSIKSVISEGKMCILDVSPQAIKVLRTSEFMPFVVFIKAPPLETLRELHEAAARSDDPSYKGVDKGTMRRRPQRVLNQPINTDMTASTATIATVGGRVVTDHDLQRTVSESLRIESAYGKYFDMVIENDNMDSSLDKLLKAIQRLHTQSSWVPVSWVY